MREENLRLIPTEAGVKNSAHSRGRAIPAFAKSTDFD
jgi:hypothetical protein